MLSSKIGGRKGKPNNETFKDKVVLAHTEEVLQDPLKTGIASEKRPISSMPSTTKLSQQASGTYLYQVLQPDLKDKHAAEFKKRTSEIHTRIKSASKEPVSFLANYREQASTYEKKLFTIDNSSPTKVGKKLNPGRNTSNNILDPQSMTETTAKHLLSTSAFKNTINITPAGVTSFTPVASSVRRIQPATARRSEISSLLSYADGPEFRLDVSKKRGVSGKPTDRI